MKNRNFLFVGMMLGMNLIPAFFVQAAEEVVRLNGGPEELHRAIEERMKQREAEGAGFGMSTEPPAEIVSVSQPRAAGGEAILVPEDHPAREATVIGDSEEYRKTLELSPRAPYSQNLAEHGTFDDAIANSNLEGIRKEEPRRRELR